MLDGMIIKQPDVAIVVINEIKRLYKIGLDKATECLDDVTMDEYLQNISQQLWKVFKQQF